MPALTDGEIRQALKRIEISRKQEVLSEGDGKHREGRAAFALYAQAVVAGRMDGAAVARRPAHQIQDRLVPDALACRCARAMADHVRSYIRVAFSWGLKAELDYRSTSRRRFKLIYNAAADILSQRSTFASHARVRSFDLRTSLWGKPNFLRSNSCVGAKLETAPHCQTK